MTPGQWELEQQQRLQMEEKNAHLTNVLNAIRKINRLIIRATDREALIDSACEYLVETRSYNTVWIALYDQQGQLQSFANAGQGDLVRLQAKLAGNEYMPCQKAALARDGLVLASDPGFQCDDCPFAVDYVQDTCVSVRLKQGDRLCGTLTVTAPAKILQDSDEQELLQDLAQDIAFGINSLALEEERQTVLQSLNQSLARYRNIAEISNDGMLLIRKNSGLFADINPAGERLFGRQGDALKEATLYQVLAKSSPEQVTQILYANEPLKIDDLTVVRPDGSTRKIILSTSPLDADTIFAIAHDITRRYELERQMVHQERLAAVGQLAAGIAHDFNNLLTTIIGNTNLLKRDRDMPPRAQRRLNQILKQGDRAAQLIRQILDFSRKSVRAPQPIDLKITLKETIKFIERAISETINYHLNWDGADNYIINADPAQLQQIITNLAVNAHDAMPGGGSLFFELNHVTLEENDPKPYQDLSPGDWVVLTVTDTGMGIAPDVLPHIFDPFFTTKAVGEGTGLGLAQVYGIIKQHDGHITVNSTVGHGTQFVIYLPALQMVDLSSMGDPALQDNSVLGHGETILLVEDASAVLKVLDDMLKTLNYQVLTAADGVEALRIYQSQKARISLVLTDVVMPNMDGYALLNALRSHNPDVKVVLMSGYPPIDDEQFKAVEDHILAWLKKPLSIQKLAEILDQAFEKTPLHP